MTHKEMTSHIRNRIKCAGIPARVKMNKACGVNYISVVVPEYDFRWNHDQLNELAVIALSNKLTGARGSSIDPFHIEQLTGKIQFDFEYHG